MNDEAFDAAVAEAVQIEQVDAKLGALERLRKSVLKERRLLRGLTIVSIVLACLAVAGNLETRSALHEFKASRAEARITSCDQYNAQAERSRDGNKKQIRVVFESLSAGRVLTQEAKDRQAAVYAAHDAVIVTAFPLRDCSPAGLRAYFDDDPRTSPFVREDDL